MTSEFVLHPRLAQDCIAIGYFELSRLLMMNDAHYPWFILVPQRAEISEIYQLSDVDQQQLLKESDALSRGLMRAFSGDKLNLAALGNVVPQLHIHHVVRYRDDPAWPAPIWGAVAPQALSAEQQQERHTVLARAEIGGLILHSD